MIARRAFLQGSTASLGMAIGLPTSFAIAEAQLISIPGAFSAPGLAYASLFLADRKKLWAAQGMRPVMKQVEGGALAMVTLNSGDSDFVCVASTDAMISLGARRQTASGCGILRIADHPAHRPQGVARKERPQPDQQHRRQGSRAQGAAHRLVVARWRSAAIHPLPWQPLWSRSREGHPHSQWSAKVPRASPR